MCCDACAGAASRVVRVADRGAVAACRVGGGGPDEDPGKCVYRGIEGCGGILEPISRLKVQLTRLSGNERVDERVREESEGMLIASAEEEVAKKGLGNG